MLSINNASHQVLFEQRIFPLNLDFNDSTNLLLVSTSADGHLMSNHFFVNTV